MDKVVNVLDNISGLPSKGIINYFEYLFVFGYMDYSNVYRLLTILFIDDLLQSDMKEFITQKDYKTLVNTIYCQIYNTCLFENKVEVIGDMTIIPRLTEDDIVRISEDGMIRIIEL